MDCDIGRVETPLNIPMRELRGVSMKFFLVFLVAAVLNLSCTSKMAKDRLELQQPNFMPGTYVTAANSSSQLRFFGYYAGSNVDPGFDEIRDSVNLVVNVFNLQDESTRVLEANGYKYNVLTWNDLPTGADWEGWVNGIRPHIPYIAAFNLADEPGCDSRTVAAFENKIRKLKSVFPNTPTWINYVANYSFTSALKMHPTIDCQIPPSLDWISLENYGKAEMTDSRHSMRSVIDDIKPLLKPHQRILLVPQGFQPALDDGEYFNLNLSEDELIAMADRNFQLALTEPLVIGIIPWLWSGGYPKQIRELPRLKNKYIEIGRAIRENRMPSMAGPVLTLVYPSAITAGRPFTLILSGENFQIGSLLEASGDGVNYSQFPLRFVSSSDVRVDSDGNHPLGTFVLRIRNPDGRVSNTRTVVVQNNLPSQPTTSGLLQICFRRGSLPVPGVIVKIGSSTQTSRANGCVGGNLPFANYPGSATYEGRVMTANIPHFSNPTNFVVDL